MRGVNEGEGLARRYNERRASVSSDVSDAHVTFKAAHLHGLYRARPGTCTPEQTDSQWAASSRGPAASAHWDHLSTRIRGSRAVSLAFHLDPLVSLHRCISKQPAHLIQAGSFRATSSHSRCCPIRASRSPPCSRPDCRGGRGCPVCAWGTPRFDACWPLRRGGRRRRGGCVCARGVWCSMQVLGGRLYVGEQTRQLQGEESCDARSRCNVGVLWVCLAAAAVCWSAPLPFPAGVQQPSTELPLFKDAPGLPPQVNYSIPLR